MYISNIKYENFDFDNPPEFRNKVSNHIGLPFKTKKVYKIKDGYFYFYTNSQIFYIYIEPDGRNTFESAIKEQYIICGNIYYPKSNPFLEEIQYQIIYKYIQETRNYLESKFNNIFVIYNDEISEVKEYAVNVSSEYNPFNFQIKTIDEKYIEISLLAPFKFFGNKIDALEFLSAEGN